MSDPGDLARVAERAAGGDIGFVLNNAGINGYGPFAALAPELLRKVLDLNVLAVTVPARAAVPAMPARVPAPWSTGPRSRPSRVPSRRVRCPSARCTSSTGCATSHPTPLPRPPGPVGDRGYDRGRGRRPPRTARGPAPPPPPISVGTPRCLTLSHPPPPPGRTPTRRPFWRLRVGRSSASSFSWSP
ncbi:hypothetical protein ACGF5T_29210 [Streptomyces sp. NPDC047853]|uniref:hypothetical protein n=1 Tax=unclassified Streptomyces TaxID=2593676 RepID=UPI003451ED31